MAVHFPGGGDESSVQLVVRYWRARAKVCVERTPEAEFELAGVLRDLNKHNKPKKFSPGPGNVLVEHKASFERVSALIEKTYNRTVRDLTFYEFFSRLKALEEDFKRQADGVGK